MAFSYIASANGGASGSGTTQATSATLNVALHDVLVVISGWYGGAAGDTVTDGGSNSFTMETVSNVNTLYARMGIILDAAANATATFTQTLDTARTWRGLVVLQFRPTAGNVQTKDAENHGTGSSTTPNSGNITTTGTDEIVVGGGFNDQIGPYASMQINAVNATGSTKNSTTEIVLWYRILTGTFSNGAASATNSFTSGWICGIEAIKSVPGGPTWGGQSVTILEL